MSSLSVTYLLHIIAAVTVFTVLTDTEIPIETQQTNSHFSIWYYSKDDNQALPLKTQEQKGREPVGGAKQHPCTHWWLQLP